MKIISSLVLCLVVFLTGCNTIRGMGQDVQRAGSAIENVGKK